MNKDELIDKIIKEAMTWVNTPYHHMGDKKNVGVDCAFLLLKIMNNAGIIDDNKYSAIKFDVGYYPMDFAFHGTNPIYLNNILKYCDRVEQPQPADIILYNWGNVPSHGALIIDYPKIIHAFMPYNSVCIDNAERLYLKKQVYGFYRLKELI